VSVSINVKKFPLFKGQEPMFLRYQSNPNSSLYNERFAFFINSPLNIET